MNIKLNKNVNLLLPGIYIIKNNITKKLYVGSTTMQMIKRLQHHYNQLSKNKHKNVYLQNTWNKYGENVFEFIALLNCEKEITLVKEQNCINYLLKKNVLYNINHLASGTPNLSKEVIEKRRNTFSIFMKEFSYYYNLLKNKDIKIEQIPNKYIKMVKSKLNQKTWNKGLTKKDISYNFLKGVKKNYSKETKDIKSVNFRKSMLKKQGIIYIYDINNNFISKYNNTWEITEDSNKKTFKLSKFMILRNKSGRNGFNPHYLSQFNIKRAIRTNLPYKGLLFKNLPLHQEIDVEKLDNIGEGCDS